MSQWTLVCLMKPVQLVGTICSQVIQSRLWGTTVSHLCWWCWFLQDTTAKAAIKGGVHLGVRGWWGCGWFQGSWLPLLNDHPKHSHGAEGKGHWKTLIWDLMARNICRNWKFLQVCCDICTGLQSSQCALFVSVHLETGFRTGILVLAVFQSCNMKSTSSTDPSITEWVRLGGTTMGHLWILLKQDHPRACGTGLSLVVLECLQWGRLYNHSRQSASSRCHLLPSQRHPEGQKEVVSCLAKSLIWTIRMSG